MARSAGRLKSRLPGPGAAEAALLLAASVRDPLGPYIRLTARYGDTIRVPYAPHASFLILSRPEHAEHILASRQDNYVKAFTYRPLRALIGDGLLTSEGEVWRTHRRLVQPLFSRRQVAAFAPVMTSAAARILRRWDRLTAESPATTLNVAGEMSALTLDVVGRTLFGADLSADAPSMSKTMGVGQRAAVIGTLLPLSWGPRTTRAMKTMVARLGGVPGGIDGVTSRLIAENRRAGRSGRPAPHDGNLLDVLLDGAAGLAEEEVAAEVTTFLLAGHETSANALSWSLALLSAFPAARRRLEEEVDSVLDGRRPEAEDGEKLPWTRAVVAEAMRLYPPAWTVERNAIADDEVAGVPVPAGALVVTPPYLVHRHPEFWPDPAGFDPGRFMPADTAPAQRRRVDASARYAYIPFGAGRRACIGQAFAELETVLVLAAITQRFRLELTGRGIPPPVAGVTLRPRHGLPMRLSRRG